MINVIRCVIYLLSTNNVFLILCEICKLFSRSSNPTHALLASKRCLIDLQKVPFKPLTNALLKYN